MLFQSIVVNVNIKDTEQYKEEKIQEEKYPVTGKLIVYCTDPEFSHINWVYYLRGIFEWFCTFCAPKILLIYINYKNKNSIYIYPNKYDIVKNSEWLYLIIFNKSFGERNTSRH